jgi:MoCo/4Fe-4S cofactor protein with predicted Tat translocation signal
MDFAAIRSRLAGAEGRLYWRSLGELGDTPEFREYLHREFPEQASEWNDPKGRRDFLKLMSASLALAGVGACTKQPLEPIVPYVRQPEDIVPGRPLFFASAIPHGGVAQPVLVESHMGRPTKIEGNPDHPASLGATDALTQAAVLGLYDPDRAQILTFRSEPRTWGNFLTAMQLAGSAQQARGGAGVRFLTGSITSPSLAEQMANVLREFPQARWHQWDPVARDGARLGARQAGAQGPALYHFDRADVVLSLDADFLSCGPGSVRYQKDFAARRRVTDDNKQMNRLYVVESSPTLTGAKADHRLPLRASEIEGFARELAGAIGGGAPQGERASVPRPDAPRVAEWIGALSGDLQAARGRSVIVAGEYQPPSVHALAHAMNQALGNIGTTVTYGAPIEAQPEDQAASLNELVAAMDAGQVELLVILGGNPVFTAPVDVRFAERLERVAQVVYHGLYIDETAHLSHWNVPATHPLESWGDDRAFDGTVTLTQPLIAPLYEGRSAHEVLGVFTIQADRRPHDIIRDYWTRAFNGGGGWNVGSIDGEAFRDVDAFWRRALHDGFITGTAVTNGGPATSLTPGPRPTPAGGAAPAGAAAAAAAGVTAPAQGQAAQPQGVAARQAETGQAQPQPGQPAVDAGQAQPQPAPVPPGSPPGNDLQPPANGGLEIIFRPDPTIWDGRFANNGWLQELPKPMTKLTWDPSAWVSPRLAEEHGLENGDVIELRYRGLTGRMPIFIVPGQPAESVTVHFGYGRQRAGRVGSATDESRDFNAYRLRTSDAPWFGQGLEIARTGDRYLLATTQPHQLMEGRAPVRVATLTQYAEQPGIIHEMGHTPPRTLTLYPEHEYTGNKWGMAIDLTTCTGCSACVVACVSENNIPIVGKDQVMRNRQMHWLRVDTYHAGDLDNPETYFQPMPCMHCENAPCEVVCPVAATAHSSEGLNDMVYNRCVGTRYCSNNCPYKVRRFNFFEYADWTTPSLHGLRNPDVTVRSRGIMEKCTYCVQRINQARIDAKREDRDIADGEIQTACQSVCPSDAIVFGNLNDPNSRLSQLVTQHRNYGLREDINTRPRTTYLAALRNPNPELEPAPPAAQREAGGH